MAPPFTVIVPEVVIRVLPVNPDRQFRCFHMRCSFVQTHIIRGNKKTIYLFHQMDGLISPEISCSGSFLSPHIDQQQQAADQGTLASPSQVAAPTRGTPDARPQSKQD